MISILAILKKEWRAIAAMVAVTLAFCGFHYVKGIRADHARLKQEVQIQNTAVTRLMEDLAANRRALDTREAESKQLAQERQDALAELERIYSTEQEACD